MLPFQIPVMLRASEVCWLHDKDNREIIELKECPQVSHVLLRSSGKRAAVIMGLLR